MNDRVITLAGAMAAILIMFGLLFGTREEVVPAGHPTTADRQARGLALVHAWLSARGEKVFSLRSRYEDLPQRFPEGGNLLITVLPQSRQAQRNEALALENWLARGNTLLVLLRPPDTGQLATIGSTTESLRQLAGLRFNLGEDEEDNKEGDEEGDEEGDDKENDDKENDDKENEVETKIDWQQALDSAFSDPQATVLSADWSTHPLVSGIEKVVSLVPSRPVIKLPQLQDGMLEHTSGSGVALAILHVKPDEEAATSDGALLQSPTPAAWLDVRGKARYLVLNLAYPFSNGALQKADNARLLTNIVEASLARHSGPRGHVIFDDMHQGLSDLYDESAFFSDHRLSNTLFVLLACWLLYALGANNRLPGMMPAVADKPRPADLVKVAGGFLANREDPRDSAERMFAHFFRVTGGAYDSHGTSDTTNHFAHLERSQRLSKAALTELKGHYSELQQGNKVNLGDVHRLMLGIRKQLT